MKNKPLLIVIALMVALLGVFGIIYFKKHGGKPDGAQQTAQTSATATSSSDSAPAPVYLQPPTVAQELAVAPIFYLQQHMKGMQIGLTAALNKRKITLADLEKLYFGGSNAPDPAYAVFNPAGKIGFQPPNGRWFGQDLVDRIARVKGTKLVYNLRRSVDKHGRITDVLYAIIPNVDAANCGMAGGNEQYVYAGEFAVAPNNSVIVQDPPDMPIMKIGCIMDSTHNLTWVYRVKLRTQAGVDKAWGSY